MAKSSQRNANNGVLALKTSTLSYKDIKKDNTDKYKKRKSPFTSTSMTTGSNKRLKKNQTFRKFKNAQLTRKIASNHAESYKTVFFEDINTKDNLSGLEAGLQPTMLAVTILATQFMMTTSNLTTTAFIDGSIINDNDNDNDSNQNVIRTNIDGDDDDVINTLAGISHYTTIYYVPILFVVGSFGNIFSMVVFSQTKLRKLSSSYYLSALAISDNIYLICLFIHWLNFIDIDIYNRQYFCQFFTYASTLSSYCSSWFVVAFTVERFIAVIYPLQRPIMCTIQRAKSVLKLLTIFGIVHSVPFAFTTHSTYSERVKSNNCDIHPKYQKIMALYNYWDSVIVYAVPFILIIILNSCTAYTVSKFAKLRRAITSQRSTNRQNDALAANVSSPLTYRMTPLRGTQSKKSRRQQQNSARRSPDESSGPSTSMNARFDNDSIQGKRLNRSTSSSQAKVNKMLVIVSSVFVILNAPSCIMRIITYEETKTSTNKKSTIVMQYIFQLFFITNFGINFLLYCVSGKNFREAVKSMFRRHSIPQREAMTQVTATECCRHSNLAGSSTQRRVMVQSYWNEIHELQPMNPEK